MSEEKVIFEGKIPIKAFLFSNGILWTFVFSWNLGLLWAFWKAITNKIRLTIQRVILIKGLITQDEEEMEDYRMKDSKFKQRIIGRIFGVGEISLWSDDSSPHCFL